MADKTINDIFDQLDRDRHLAAFPLEERASPFFKEFLPAVLQCYITDVKLPIIPEFPYEKDSETNRSPKVDFFSLSEKGDHAFFIELKTDMNSLDPGQIDRLNKATGRKLTSFIDDIASMAQTSNKQNRQKYFHLLQTLEDLELIEMDPVLTSVMFAANSKGVYDLIKKIVIKSNDLCPEIIYVIPREYDIPSAELITFEQFASVVEKQGDLGKRFAKSLREWAEVDAGSARPGANCP